MLKSKTHSSPAVDTATVTQSDQPVIIKVGSYLDPVYPDHLYTEEANLEAIRLHEEQGLNPTIVKYLFKGATTDKMSGDRNGMLGFMCVWDKLYCDFLFSTHAIILFTGKLILLGRDGNEPNGKFWMLKSDGVRLCP